jgi:hypothetical protein
MVIHRFPLLASTNPATKSSDSAPQIAQAPSPFCKFITQPVAFFGAKRPLDQPWEKTHGNMAVCQNLVPLVNIKIAGKWMFIPLKMVLIGIDPYPYELVLS